MGKTFDVRTNPMLHAMKSRPKPTSGHWPHKTGLYNSSTAAIFPIRSIQVAPSIHRATRVSSLLSRRLLLFRCGADTVQTRAQTRKILQHPPRTHFQADFLHNGGIANAERCVYGKTSAISFQIHHFHGVFPPQIGQSSLGNSSQGGCLCLFLRGMYKRESALLMLMRAWHCCCCGKCRP